MVALPFIAAGASAAKSLLGGISSAESAAYNAQVARNNATIERQNAGYSAGATATQTEVEGLKARAQLASTRASLAANGMDVNSGSAAQVQTDARTAGALDQAIVAGKGAEEVYGYQSKATGFQAQANLDQSQVIPDLIGGGLGAVGDIAKAVPNLPTASGGGLSQNALPSNFTTSLPADTSLPGPTIAETGSSSSSIYDWAGGNPTAGEFNF